jgi:ribosomal protein S19
MVGCKLGEFSYTKRSDTQTHLKKKRKKKPKGKK